MLIELRGGISPMVEMFIGQGISEHIGERGKISRVEILPFDPRGDCVAQVAADGHANRSALARRDFKCEARARAKLMHGIDDHEWLRRHPIVECGTSSPPPTRFAARPSRSCIARPRARRCRSQARAIQANQNRSRRRQSWFDCRWSCRSSTPRRSREAARREAHRSDRSPDRECPKRGYRLKSPARMLSIDR